MCFEEYFRMFSSMICSEAGSGLPAGSLLACSFTSPPDMSQTIGSFSSQFLTKLLGTGVEPARAINAGDFKSPVSTIPPSEQKETLIKDIRVY